MQIIRAAIEVNSRQQLTLLDKVRQYFGDDISGRTFGCLGLSFKAHTSDIRESPAMVNVQQLLASGANVNVYDPAAQESAKQVLGLRVSYCKSVYAACDGVDGVLI